MDLVSDSRRSQRRCGPWRHLPEGGQRVGERCLGDHRCDPGVAGGDGEHVTAGERGPPHHDPVGIDPLEAAGPVDDGVVVGVLPPDVEQLARLAGRGAEVAIVEHHDEVTRGLERLGVGGQPVVAGRTEAVCHHDARTARVGGGAGLRPVEIGGDLLAFGPNADIFAGRHVLTVVRRRVHLNRTPVRLLWGHVRLRRVEDLPAGLVGALIYRRG